MSEKFVEPLVVAIDHRGAEPRFVINGTNYARNVLGGSLRVEPFNPDVLGRPKAKVTVTFMVDDLSVLSKDADSADVSDVRLCGGVS